MINDSIALLIIINFDSKLQGSYCMQKVTQYQNIANIQIPSTSSEILGKQPYACPEEGCNSKFRYKAWLNRHVDQVHLNIRPYACPQCSYTFHVSNGLQQHVNAVHLKIKPHACKYPQCSYTCSLLANLQRHIQIIHEKIKPFTCTKCDEEFYTKASLHRHYTTKNHKTTNVQNKNPEIKDNQTIMYDGSIKKRKLDNSSLTVEDASSNSDNKNADSSTWRSEKGDKPYASCSECSKKFRCKWNRDRHVASVHLKEKPYTCPTCNKGFSNRASKDRHLREVHLKDKFCKGKRFKSQPLPNVAITNASLQKHMKIVDGQKRPFICIICNKNFLSKCNVIDHIKRHKKIKDFTCVICDVAFYTRRDLNSHIKSKCHKKNKLIQEVQNKNPRIKANQDTIDGISKRPNLNNSSLTVEDATSNYDNKKADSSTWRADYGLMKATQYKLVVETNNTKPNFLGDCFLDVRTESLVEKYPGF
jgi:transcription elongation factor Elf1